MSKHLEGKNAEQIVDEVKNKYRDKAYDYVYIDDYVRCLEMLLLLAVKDALCNVDENNMHQQVYIHNTEAESRAVAFLNRVLPEE